MKHELARLDAEVVAETGAGTSKGLPVLPHPSREDRQRRGRAARTSVPLASLAQLSPPDPRPDPLGLLEQQAATRVPELIPIRYGRMLMSPFAFYRGAALLMASDLSGLPNSGLRTQLCGDAHVSNFGVFGTPERNMVFDVNDFDETLPGPFEWDVKRLAASLEIAAREQGFSRKQRRAVVLASALAYRETMRLFARQPNLVVWYAQLDVDRELRGLLPTLQPDRARLTEEMLAKARTHDSMQAFKKLTTVVDGKVRIRSQPPLVVPVQELLPEQDANELFVQLRSLLRSYRRTLQTDRRHLLEQFRLVDMARKVVGVGSVGTRAWVMLLQGIDDGDPLLLQAKEAQSSVLEAYVGASSYANHGARVVAGQHLMQASSDIFLGWQRAVGVDGVERDYYVRQLRDWKGSLPLEQMVPRGMTLYGQVCGWTLARAHARSGDRTAIAAYLGSSDAFDQAIADFATAYADLNEKDYEALKAAVASGRVTAQTGV
ncbi:MAG TPA: DUF2252 domain-containing protein [Actinomycetes bacterium]|nr:DUF2252 domain-containing protein [Actinomycetes bacterium]